MSRFRNRVNVYGRRALRSMTSRALRRPVLFLHLPKCGGTALAEGMYGTVGLQNRIGVIDAVSTRRAAALLHADRNDPLLCHEDLPLGDHTFALREALALTHLNWTTRMIHGHLLATPRLLAAVGPDWALMTMLREPRARALSNYRMAVRAGVIEDDLDAWLSGAVGQSMAQVYLRYFSGRNVIPEEERQRALEQAECHMSRFELIGFLDDPQGFQRACADVLGVRPHFPRRNTGDRLALRLTPRQEQTLDSLLAPDRYLYDVARQCAAGMQKTAQRKGVIRRVGRGSGTGAGAPGPMIPSQAPAAGGPAPG